MKKMTYKTAKRIIKEKIIRTAALIVAGYSIISAMGCAETTPTDWCGYVKSALAFIIAVVVAYDKDRYLAKTHKCRAIFYH